MNGQRPEHHSRDDASAAGHLATTMCDTLQPGCPRRVLNCRVAFDRPAKETGHSWPLIHNGVDPPYTLDSIDSSIALRDGKRYFDAQY